MKLNYILAHRPAGQGAQPGAGARHEHGLYSAFEGEPGTALPTHYYQPKLLLASPEQVAARSRLGLPPSTLQPRPQTMDVVQAARRAA